MLLCDAEVVVKVVVPFIAVDAQVFHVKLIMVVDKEGVREVHALEMVDDIMIHNLPLLLDVSLRHARQRLPSFP